MTASPGPAPDLFALTADLAADELVELDRRLVESLPGDCLLAELGIVPTHIGRGRCRAEMAIGRRHLNQRGIVQAGALVSLGDAAAGWASYSAAEAGLFTTVDLTVHLLRAVRAGDEVVAEARPVHLGRSTHVIEVAITRRPPEAPEGAGPLVARLTCTQLILQPRPQPGGAG